MSLSFLSLYVKEEIELGTNSIVKCFEKFLELFILSIRKREWTIEIQGFKSTPRDLLCLVDENLLVDRIYRYLILVRNSLIFKIFCFTFY